MKNNSQLSSNLTRGLNIMNLKFWGGWFLAIACACIFLTMGCDNGSLGVKYSSVSGRLVNKDNISLGVPNATVRMVSKEAVSGGGELQQGYNFRSTVTDNEGYFLFEKVQPDNVIFEFSAPGYRKTIFPATSDSSEEDGSTSESMDVESVTISNNDHIDLANVLMEKISVTLPSSVNIKLEFIDSNTKKRVDDNEFFSVSFDGVPYLKKAKAWRETGVDGITGANEIKINIKNEAEPVLYNSASMTIEATRDQYYSVEVEPVTYSLTFQFLTDGIHYVLDSENKAVLSFLVEDSSTIPAQSISVTSVSDFSQFAILNIPAVRHPQQVRMRMKGYKDEVIDLTNASDLTTGTKGSYRVDVDFDMEDGHSGEDKVTLGLLGGKIGLKDNVIKKNVEINMIGLQPNDKARVSINLPHDPAIVWSQSYLTSDNENIGLANAEGTIKATFKEVPVGYDMTYNISVFPDNVGSQPYLISSEKAIPIPVPANEDIIAKVLDLDISKIDATSTSEE